MSTGISYKKKYFRTYIWQTVSILLGFASLFVVVPYLSSDKTLYGIYSVCTSLTIFFAYADLGFISAGVKYAAEYFIRGDKEDEMKVIGFTAFIMMSAFAVVALGIIFLAIFPEFLIPDVEIGSEGYRVARALLLTLAFSCPMIIGQRILAIVFTIRVEDYLYQRFVIVGNIVRIISVLFFFHDGQYRIVEYFIFYQIISLAVVTVALFYTKHYEYRVRDLICAIRFDRTIFDKVKNISGVSLVMTICMILYYELDQIVISRLFGIDKVAIYGAALSVLTIIRSFSSLVFSPYSSRYNHYVGLGDYNGLTSFVKKMIMIFGIVLIVPIGTISFFAKPFVVSWIGDRYIESAILVSFMALSFAPNFVKDPICSYFIATERSKILLKSNCIMPIVYWVGIAVTWKYWGINSFAIFKSVAPIIVAIGYWYIIVKDYKERGYSFISLKDAFGPLIIPLVVLGILSLFILPYMFYSHDKISLMLNILIMGVCLMISLVIGIFSNKILKHEIGLICESVIKKIKRV